MIESTWDNSAIPHLSRNTLMKEKVQATRLHVKLESPLNWDP